MISGYDLSPGEMKVMVVLAGGGRIGSEEAGEVEFARGDTLLIPAAYEGVITFSGDTEYLIVTV